MVREDFLPQVQNTELPVEHRLTLVAQFVVLNGQDGPMDLIPQKALPRGFVFRARFVRDLVVCLAISEREARENAHEAVDDSAQLWQLALNEETGVDPRHSGVVCTLHGALTKVTLVNDRKRADTILAEWTESPPTALELAPVSKTSN